MRKKLISILMVAVILTATIFDFLQLNVDNKALASSNTIILDDGRVVTLPPGVPTQITVKGKAYELNKDLLIDSEITTVPNLEKGIAVYGTPEDVDKVYDNDYDSKSGEWRYLGFDINANKYSNPDFPPDADSGRSPSQKNWQSLDYIYKMNIEHPSPYNNDSNAGKWLQTMVWLRDIERGGKNPDEYDPIWLSEHFHILSPPTNYTAGLARGWHKTSSGKLWYETFVMPPTEKIEVPENPPNVVADFELKDEVYEYQDVGYKDTSYAEYSAIEYRKLTIIGDNGYIRTIENNKNPDIRLKEGSYTFTLEVRNNAGQTDTMTKNIKVIKQQPDVPSKAIAIINAPDEATINETFTVTGEGSFPSTGAKIIEWKWYFGTDALNLVHDPSYDNKNSINVSYGEEGIRVFQLWIKDTAGKEAWSNVASTNIISDIIASAVAKINVPDFGYEGVSFPISTHGSYVTVEDKKYSLKKAVDLGYADYVISGVKKIGVNARGGEGIINELGKHSVSLKISPKNGNIVRDKDYITILPTPVAELDIKGDLKVNRLVKFDGSDSIISEKHPLSIEYITVKELSTGTTIKINKGQEINNSFIRTKDFSYLNLDCIFKKPGDYEILLYIEDDRGNSSTDTEKITIKEDKPPMSKIYIQKTLLRNPNNKLASVTIYSQTKSIDNDYVNYREYYYKFDSDNDNSFDDENWIFVNRITDNVFSFSLNKVGKYLIKEIAKERFGTETIEEFVTEDDRKESSITKIIEIDNKEPIASFFPIKSKNIDVMFNYNKNDKDMLLNNINTYENEVINDESALLRPTTYLNEFTNSTEHLELISQGNINSDQYGGLSHRDENKNYMVVSELSTTTSDFAINKENFEIFEIPFLQYHSYNLSFTEDESFLQKYIQQKSGGIYYKTILGNTNYIWSPTKLYNLHTKQQYILPVSINIDKPFFVDEKNGYFYYSDINNQLTQYDLNKHTAKTIFNTLNYNIFYASDNKIFLVNKNFNYGVDYSAYLEILTLDYNGNILNKDQLNVSLPAPNDGNKYILRNHVGFQSCYLDETSNKMYLMIQFMLRRYNKYTKDYYYYDYIPLIKIDINGNINNIYAIDELSDYFNDTSEGKLDYIEFRTRSDGNFEITKSLDKHEKFKRIIFDKIGNVINNYIKYTSNWMNILNYDNERYLIFRYSNSRDYYQLVDMLDNQVLITVEDNITNGDVEVIFPVKGTDNLFYVLDDRTGTYIYNADTDISYTVNNGTSGFYLRNVIKENNKLYMFTDSYIRIYEKTDESYDLIEEKNNMLGNYVASNDLMYHLYFYHYGRFEYDYYRINPGFFEIIKHVKNTHFGNKDRYIVIIEDKHIPSTEEQKIDLINVIKEKEAKVIWYGNSNNRNLANTIIAETGGYFRNYNTFEVMMSDLASILKQDNSDLSDREKTLYIKKGEYINYEKVFADYENDPQHTESGEQWLYIHFPNYFSNNDGLASFHNKWLSSPITKFDKVGKYTVTLKLRDNPVGNDNRFDNYRKWNTETNQIDIIVYDDDSVIQPQEDVPPQLIVNISGDLRINHRVDFIITAIKGSKDIDWNSLNISFDRADYLPNSKPNALEFSRVFTQTGEHNITVTLKDVEGNPTTVTVPFTIKNDLPPIADFNLTGDGKRNELGIANFEINDSSYSNDDEIGEAEYYIENIKYTDNGDGTYTPSGTEFYPLEFNEFGEIELDKIGLNKIKQVVTETYVNGIGLNGEDLDKYRVFKSSEIIKTVNVINEAPQVEYVVTPNIIKVRDNIEHITNITDDTPSGDYAEYKLVHDETYFLNSQGKHNNHNIITTEPTEVLDKKGKYDFYVKGYDEDGASTDWIHGGQVIVASEPIADFELVSPGNEVGNDVFKKVSVITIENKAYNEDYENTVPNHGIEYMKVEYRNIGDDSYTTIFEGDNMPNYIPTFDIPQINESGIYEVKMTVKSPEGIEATCTKQFTVLDLRLYAELEPSTIYASQSYKIKATLSTDGLGAVAYIPYSNEWIVLDKVNQDSNNKYFEKEITTNVSLADRVYDIEVYGIYPYNNEIKEVIPLTVETPIELTSDIKAIGPTEYIQTIQDNDGNNDYISVPAGEKIKITAEVISPVTVEYVKAQLEGEGEINLSYKSILNIYEGEINIPGTKLDKDYYNLNIETSLPNGNIAINHHKVKINTPINLLPNIPGELISDTTVAIKAETSKYVETLTVTLYKGESFEKTLTMTVDRIIGNKKEWIANYDVPVGLPEGTYIAEFTARTPNGNVDVDNKTFILQSLDLIDLRITNIINHPSYETKYPILYNDPIVPVGYKTGYYITFKINAKGSPDSVKMKITYKGYNKEFEMTKESQNGNDSVWKLEWYADPFTPFGTIINTEVIAQKGETTLNFNNKYGWNGDYLKVIGTIEQDWRIDQEF